MASARQVRPLGEASVTRVLKAGGGDPALKGKPTLVIRAAVDEARDNYDADEPVEGDGQPFSLSSWARSFAASFKEGWNASSLEARLLRVILMMILGLIICLIVVAYLLITRRL